MNPVRRDALPVLVAEEIKRDIMHGRFKPGEKLPGENELSKVLGVGRPTVREAFRILQGQGLVSFELSGGAHVKETCGVARGSASHFRREELIELLEFELAQLQEEGKQLPAGSRDVFARLKSSGTSNELEDFYASLSRLDQRTDFRYVEPSELAQIQSESAFSDETRKDRPMSADLGDRIHGAWLGRCIGCLAGKPVEGWSQENIASYLRATASYPLTGYIPFDPEKQAGGDFAVNVQARDQTRGNISRMVADDDIDYTILNLDIVSKYGREFTTEDVGEEWLSRLPYRSTFSAERQAYANLVRGMQPPASATYRNPFREWIGATIRADLFGYITPGNPRLASSLAFKDASLSHVRNGIYGEMFVAGVISAALGSGDLEGSIRTGQSLIPRSSRLAEVVETVLALARRTESWEEALRGVQGAYDRYNHTHVLANVAVTVLALLFGEHDFRKTVSIAVMCGWDTDCNGATAGSIMGAILGTAGIPSDLAEPLNDRVRTTLSGQCELSLRALAERTTALCRAGRDPAAREV